MNKKLCLLGALILLSCKVMATDVNNNYVFIDNEVDGEYFITPEKTDPRFSGANVFTKYSETQQLSMGYMGYTGAFTTNSYADIWLENSPINTPFLGSRCMRNASACPSTGYLAASNMLKDGAYHIPITTASGEAHYPRGIFSSSAYEYFRNVSTGTTEVYKYHYCSTKTDYDPAAGQTCVSVGGKDASHEFSVTKVGQVILESTNALQEIFIDSDGNPTIGIGSGFCNMTIVNNVNGASCKLVSASVTGKMLAPMRLTMKVDTAQLGFTPAANSILLSKDGSNNWKNYNANIKAEDILSPESSGIYVFFSKTFLKQLIDRSTDLTNSKDFFTFSFTNTAVPQSGYYEFSPSNTIVIHPRDYGISIISKDLAAHPSREGKVGTNEPPLLFEYLVTTSGPRQANDITAQVSGPTKNINGRDYCIFSSDDGKLTVPFSAYLSYTSTNGKTVKERSSCNDKVISLNDALWEQTPWADPNQNDGSFYKTNLNLTFPMNESASLFSEQGEDWIGMVSATGEVKVSAVWSGPDVN